MCPLVILVQLNLQMVDLNMATDAERMAAVQEVLVLKTISHPNIVAYQDSFIGKLSTQPRNCPSFIHCTLCTLYYVKTFPPVSGHPT